MMDHTILRAPVVLFMFNRPDFTARVLDVVATARPSRLLVVGDGPRPGNPDDLDLVRQTRRVIERVDWPCEVSTNYSDRNLGCGRRFATGLDWVFGITDEAIILEDDCLPEPTFFRFCDELLDRYRANEHVQMISGCNVLRPDQSGHHSYYFSRCYHIWGWATWSRAWAHYDYEMRSWPELRRTRWLEQHLSDKRAARISEYLFDQTHAGHIDQWDFQWVLAGWRRNAVSVIPSINLVRNIGFGRAATHLRDANHPHANLELGAMQFPLRHPPEVDILEAADQAEWESVFPDYASLEPPTRRSQVLSAIRTPLATAARAGLRAFGRGLGRVKTRAS